MIKQISDNLSLPKYLLVLSIISTCTGIVLLHYNRALYNEWFLGLGQDEWSIWTFPQIDRAGIADYWAWAPGRMLLLFCGLSWTVALGTGFWLMLSRLKNDLTEHSPS